MGVDVLSTLGADTAASVRRLSALGVDVLSTLGADTAASCGGAQLCPIFVFGGKAAKNGVSLSEVLPKGGFSTS